MVVSGCVVSMLISLLLLDATCTQALKIGTTARRRILPPLSVSDSDETTLGSKLESFLYGNFSLPTLPEFSVPSAIAGALVGVASFVAVLALPIAGGPDSGMLASDSVVLQSLDKPVQLFGDVLFDLSASYVEEVNVNKLFETAMAAMLKSLDPYTEFENAQSAKSMQESVSGRYGGVGLVIASTKPKVVSPLVSGKKLSDADGGFKGVTVMDSFEGYAFDGGLRVGDRLVAIGGVDVRDMGVERVRDYLRGDPDSDVLVRFERDGYGSPRPLLKEAVLTRRLVRISDVRLATFLGAADAGIGYINVSGFNSGTGRDFGNALLQLRLNAPSDLKGLVVDLRGNPGGLLDEAVEMASYLLPARSGVVSSRGKDGTEFVYKSVIDPIRGPAMKLVVLVNGGSASAAEIVAGAVQDTDSGVIVGPSKTFGKGLVQKIVPLPFDNALKFTVAKYYTPSGRCIQAINYRGGRGDAGLTASSQRSNGEEGFVEGLEESEATAVSEDQRKTFYTAKGRSVRDGGGIEPDFLVPELKAGPAESVFLTRGVYFDFISEYVKTHDSLAPLKELVMRDRRTRYDDTRIIGGASAQSLVLDSFPRIKAEDRLFDEFRRYVSSRVAAGTLSVTDAFNKPLADLEKSLASTGLQDATSGVEAVKQRIAASIMRDLDSHRSVISNDLELSLLSRELPDRLLLQKSVLQDAQVAAAVELIADEPKYAVLLRASEVVPGSGPSDGDKAFRLAGAH